MMSEEIRAKYDRLFDRTVVDGKTIKQEIDRKIEKWTSDAYRVAQYVYVLENRSHDDQIKEAEG